MKLKQVDFEEFTIIEGRDFSHQGLLNWLNLNFRKRNKKPFLFRDVFFYVKRGYLPTYLGYIKIERIDLIRFGLILLRLTEVDEIGISYNSSHRGSKITKVYKNRAMKNVLKKCMVITDL